MGTNNNSDNKSRRGFFTALFSGNRKEEKVKMLTADGKLVEIEKTAYDRITKKQKAGNKEIYDWMENPCKKDNNI